MKLCALFLVTIFAQSSNGFSDSSCEKLAKFAQAVSSEKSPDKLISAYNEKKSVLKITEDFDAFMKCTNISLPQLITLRAISDANELADLRKKIEDLDPSVCQKGFNRAECVNKYVKTLKPASVTVFAVMLGHIAQVPLRDVEEKLTNKIKLYPTNDSMLTLAENLDPKLFWYELHPRFQTKDRITRLNLKEESDALHLRKRQFIELFENRLNETETNLEKTNPEFLKRSGELKSLKMRFAGLRSKWGEL